MPYSDLKILILYINQIYTARKTILSKLFKILTIKKSLTTKSPIKNQIPLILDESFYDLLCGSTL